MRNARYEYGRDRLGWWITVTEGDRETFRMKPKGGGNYLGILNGVAPTLAQAFLLDYAIVLSEKERPQEPKAPPSYFSEIQELYELSPEEAVARARRIEAGHDEFEGWLRRNRGG